MRHLSGCRREVAVEGGIAVVLVPDVHQRQVPTDAGQLVRRDQTAVQRVVSHREQQPDGAWRGVGRGFEHTDARRCGGRATKPTASAPTGVAPPAATTPAATTPAATAPGTTTPGTGPPT